MARRTLPRRARGPATTVLKITVFNSATQIAGDYSVEAETEARAVAALTRELASRAACTITVEHTSYFRGHPGVPGYVK